MPLPFPRHDLCGGGSESPMFMFSSESKDRKEDVCEMSGGGIVGEGGGK